MWAHKSNDDVTIAVALRWTIEQGLGDAWNPETARALRAMFTMYLEELLRGAGAKG